MYKIGFIGTGNMGSAMLGGAMGSFKPEDIAFSELDSQRADGISASTGAHLCESAARLVSSSKIIVLSVKPQSYPVVLEEIKEELGEDKILISLAPSYSIAQLKAQLGEECRIIRAMPNTPAKVGEGMTGICLSGDEIKSDEWDILNAFFTSFGRYEQVPEKLMDAVTAASGSSPAFVYMMAEALADGVNSCGMPRDMAYRFVAQAILGSAKMLLESGLHPAELKDSVCSPGGTTIAGVAVLEEKGFRSAIIEAAREVCRKCHDIS